MFASKRRYCFITTSRLLCTFSRSIFVLTRSSVLPWTCTDEYLESLSGSCSLSIDKYQTALIFGIFFLSPFSGPFSPFYIPRSVCQHSLLVLTVWHLPWCASSAYTSVYHLYHGLNEVTQSVEVRPSVHGSIFFSLSGEVDSLMTRFWTPVFGCNEHAGHGDCSSCHRH